LRNPVKTGMRPPIFSAHPGFAAWMTMPKLSGITQKAGIPQKLISQVGKLTGGKAGGTDIEARRARDLARKNAAYREAKAIFIPKPKDPRKRGQAPSQSAFSCDFP
jgi:hypothetical protein